MQKVTYSQLQSDLALYEYFIIDGKLESLYPDLAKLAESKTVFWLDDAESSKSIEVWHEAIDYFLAKKIHRQTKIIAIGGGATTDFAGFVAATILRGVEWIAVPTTLLAMIDASIGGKTGINSAHGKNLIGAFHSPENILICDSFLETLSEGDLNSGKGELLKYFFLSQAVVSSWNKEVSTEVIASCAKYKLEIVAADPFEQGERMLLNLGHTFGHAIEKCLGIPHGIAVAYGLRLMIDVMNPELIDTFNQLTQEMKIELKQSLNMNKDEFLKFLRLDKKRINNEELNIIVPQRIGQSSIELISFEKLEELLKNATGYFSTSS